MAHYREDSSAWNWQQRAPLSDYSSHVDSNAWRATEISDSEGRRPAPFGFNDADRANMFRSNFMPTGPQQPAWRPGLSPQKEDSYSEQRELEVSSDGFYGTSNQGPYTPDSKDRRLSRPLSPPSIRSTDRLSYMSHVGDPPSYPGLSREREMQAYPSQSRERESYFNLPCDQASYSDLSREQLPSQNPVRDLPPYTSFASNFASPDQRRDVSLDPGNTYSRRLSPYDLNEERLPRSSPSDYENSRSRSPLGNRDLSFQREVPGHYQSQFPRERLPSLPAKTSFRQEVKDGSSSRSVQSGTKGGGFGDKQKTTGSVLRVDGLPAENKAGCVTQLLARLGAYGTVTDVQLHESFENQYALFFYSDGNAAYVALENVKKTPLFIKSLKFSVWVLEADREKPLTITLTRVMYVENLDKKVSLKMLYSLCGKVGEILDIEIKETPGRSFNTAIVQYWDASNAKFAAQALNKEKIGNNVVKATSGKNTPSNCVWIDGLINDLDGRELTTFFEQYGLIEKYLFDRQRGAALIMYPTRVPARQCVRSLENGKTALGGQLIRADYANERAQLAFCKSMEQSGQHVGNFLYA